MKQEVLLSQGQGQHKNEWKISFQKEKKKEKKEWKKERNSAIPFLRSYGKFITRTKLQFSKNWKNSNWIMGMRFEWKSLKEKRMREWER